LYKTGSIIDHNAFLSQSCTVCNMLDKFYKNHVALMWFGCFFWDLSPSLRWNVINGIYDFSIHWQSWGKLFAAFWNQTNLHPIFKCKDICRQEHS